jgi:mRNA interferase MazF
VKRGELFRVYKGSKQDPKNYRVFLIVSRQTIMNTRFTTVICAPVYSNYNGIDTQVKIGVEEGMKHESAVYCDDLVSLNKNLLTDYVGCLSSSKMEEVNNALRIALSV